jgi:hypothetical protein
MTKIPGCECPVCADNYRISTEVLRQFNCHACMDGYHLTNMRTCWCCKHYRVDMGAGWKYEPVNRMQQEITVRMSHDERLGVKSR